MADFVNNCLFNPTLGGTTDWTVSTAVTGYMTPTAAGAVNGRTYKYRAENTSLTEWEYGEGVWNSGTGVLTRVTVFQNSAGTTAKINFTTAPFVGIVHGREDTLLIEAASSWTAAQKSQARVNQDIFQSYGLASSTDFDAVLAPGSYYTIDALSTNTPLSGHYWYLTVDNYSTSNYSRQIATRLESASYPDTYVRIRDSGVWKPWRKLLSAPRQYLAGLALGAAGSSSSFSIAAGCAVDSGNNDMMELNSAYTKTTGNWAVGSGNGALNTGSLVNGTWYEVHLIKRLDTGVVDVMFTTPANSGTLPSGYNISRRIGWLLYVDGTTLWRGFYQNGDYFWWITNQPDYSNSSLGTTNRVTLTLTAAPSCRAVFRGLNYSTAGSAISMFGPLAETDLQTNAGGGFSVNGEVANNGGAGHYEVFLDASRRMACRSQNGTTTSIYINTLGWLDTRGKL